MRKQLYYLNSSLAPTVLARVIVEHARGAGGGGYRDRGRDDGYRGGGYGGGYGGGGRGGHK